MELCVDYREFGIIEKLTINKQNINYSTSNLLIGDFIIKETINATKDEYIHYIIERKSINDLVSSITDGRFREQKQRLLDSIGTPEKIIYILEGNKNKKFSLSQQIIDGAILNLLFKHKYRIIFTENQDDTLRNILLLYNKIKTKVFEKTIQLNEVIPIRLIKKKDSINNNILVNMLSVIPGVSIIIAQKIKQEYFSMQKLIIKYTESNFPENMLSNLQITEKRKLVK